VTDARDTSEVGYSGAVDRRAAVQLGSFAGGPCAVLLSQAAKSATVPWACLHDNMLPAHAAELAAVLVAVASGLIALREWRRSGGGWPDEEGGERGRSRFLAVLSLLLAAVSLLVILAQWIPDAILSPCQQ